MEAQTRTSSSVEPEEDTAYEQRLTQRLEAQRDDEEENVPVDNGIIERVHVENFMCHANFTWDLGPLINFVCGKNGSGKSAVLTAITLCLGGKASATNRGSSLKSFIQDGKDFASIKVTIKNQGQDAFMREEFGDSIEIERHFNRNGTSGFKIRSARGRVVSTTKATLDEICDYYALQIDNPMNVLSQDLARQFIVDSGPSKKYQLFIKGVQLEQLDNDYKVMSDSIDEIEGKLGGLQDNLKIYQARKEKARARKDMSDKHQNFRGKMRELRRQLAWAQVEDQERARDDTVDDLRKVNSRIALLEEEAAGHDAAFQEADTANAQAAAHEEAAKADLDRVQGEKRELKASFDEIKSQCHDMQLQQRDIKSHLTTANQDITNAERDIGEEMQRLEELDGGSHGRRLAEIEEKKTDAADMKSRYDDHRGDIQRLQDNQDDAERTFERMREPITRKQEEIGGCETQLQNLSRDRGDQNSAFPTEMPLLLRAIQRETRFAERPIGPVGNFVRLRRPEWSSQIEKSFGGTLSSFIVTSKTDMNVLTEIMRRVKCVLPIIIGNNDPIDTTPNEPDVELDTVLRVLEIENDLVKKQLVIQHGIEQTILIADMEKASRVLYDEVRPRNVKRCYCIDRRNKRRGFALSYTRSGEASQDPLHAYEGRPRMRTDIETQITLRREQLQDLKRELNELEQQQRGARNNVEKCKQAIVRHKRQERELQLESQRAEDEVESLQEALDRDSVEDGRLEALKSHLENAKEQKRLNEGSYQDSVVALDAIKEKLSEARNKLSSMDERIAELQAESKKAEKETLKIGRKRTAALGEKNAAFERVDDAKQDKEALEQRRETLEDRVKAYDNEATKICPRVNIGEGETYASLEKKYEKLGAEVEKFQQQMGASHEDLIREATKAKKEYDDAVTQVKSYEELAQRLKYTLVNRRGRWEKFRNYIVSRAKIQFTYLLSERSFRGKLLTNHKEKLLDIQVEPDITRDGSGRGARTLSGGEKSFSQICLLLSLWEAMGAPIRCLDEFDVYMDAVNRKLSIDLLMSAARRSRGRQFILISPGTRAEIRAASDVHVTE